MAFRSIDAAKRADRDLDTAPEFKLGRVYLKRAMEINEGSPTRKAAMLAQSTF